MTAFGTDVSSLRICGVRELGSGAPRRYDSCLRFDRRFLQNTAPTLSFDRIGVRHSGIEASAGSPIGLRQVGSSVLPFDFRSAGSSTIRNACRRCVVDFCKWFDNWNELFLGDLAPAPSAMPGCRAPMPSKTKQQVGALFCRKSSIEAQIAGSNVIRSANYLSSN